MADPADETQDEDHSESSVLKELRAKAKRVEDAESRAAAAERKLLIREANLSHLDDEQLSALTGGQELDIDSLKAKAEKWGWVNPPGESTPGRGGSTPQTDLQSEAAELSNLTGSTVEVEEQPGPRTQEAVDKTVRSFDRADDLKAWMRENMELFDRPPG